MLASHMKRERENEHRTPHRELRFSAKFGFGHRTKFSAVGRGVERYVEVVVYVLRKTCLEGSPNAVMRILHVGYDADSHHRLHADMDSIQFHVFSSPFASAQLS